MTVKDSKLPAGFEALEPYVAEWAVKGSANRSRRRLESDADERAAFFEAARPLLEPALARLDEKPLDQFDAAEKRLMDLMLTFAHISLAGEIQGEDEPRHARDARFLTITRTPADVNA